MTLTQLEALGFDDCTRGLDGYIAVGCMSCAALVIQGTPCHERGCPSEMHECNGCNNIVPKRQRYCEDCS